MPSSKPIIRFLSKLSYLVKALWIFFPGILFLLLGLFIFLQLPQGKDIIYQSTDMQRSWVTGLYLVLAALFWVFTTWYTARLIAYDRNDLYKKAPAILYHFPRLLGFSIFLVIWLAIFTINDNEGNKNTWSWIAILIDFAVYWWFHRSLERSLQQTMTEKKITMLRRIRILISIVIAACCILIIVAWQLKYIDILLITLPALQLGFLFLVIVRYPLYRCGADEKKLKLPDSLPDNKKHSFWHRYFYWTLQTAFRGFDRGFEITMFTVYHLFVGIAFICYLLCINSLRFARELTSFTLVFLSFGILLGIINLVSLIARRSKINITFILMLIVVGAGFLFESHRVRLIDSGNKQELVYRNRAPFETYLSTWIGWHKDSLDKYNGNAYPVFFILADGGASRSGYWVASVLSKLHEKTRYQPGTSHHSYFMDHTFSLSGASGGSVGNASFLAAYMLQEKDPSLATDSLCKKYLSNDFLVYPLAKIFGPDLLKPAFGWFNFWGDRAASLEYSMEHPAEQNSAMGNSMRNAFRQMLPSNDNELPILSINTTRVNDGSPGVISTIHIDSSKKIFGTRIDVLDLVPAGKDIRLSTAMVLGARFPYMSPGGKLGNSSYFVDGGYFDNSGAGVIHEMLLQLDKLKKDSSNKFLYHYLNKMQFYVIHLSNTPIEDPATNEKKRIHPFLNDLATPLLTLAGSYNSQTNINDARLTNYLRELNRDRDSYIIFNLYTPRRKENISMNWVISEKARDTMDSRLRDRRMIDVLAAKMMNGPRDNLFGGLIVDENKAR